MRQFVYLLVGGFIVYGWWQYAQSYEPPMTIFLPLAIPVGLIAVAFALVKINDRPFEYFISSFIKFLFTPKKRMWHEGYKPDMVITVDKVIEKKVEVVKTSEDLDSLAKTLEAKSQEIIAKEPVALRAKKPAAAAAGAGSSTLTNLSVKDVKSAAEKQNQAQTATPIKKTGGIWGLFKR